ncbi:hypothetical protein ARMGADRAFT_1093350 [Armillaria gallica]|uniref:Uncharacterized protein n=1 Tax=Armillaria gallica TaxID=47427 RepID=A0A2H3CD31_ARMGA|nr:hypothetical protein ARMGADRAFT_1093350 [Armillaria gallica]
MKYGNNDVWQDGMDSKARPVALISRQNPRILSIQSLEAHQRLEKLRVLKLEEEQKVDEKRQEDEQVQLEAKKAVKKLKEREDAIECKWIEDLEAKEKEKEKEDEANELALVAVGAPSASDGDSEVDLTDPKMIAMAKLRRRHKIAKGKRREETMEPQKCKIQSASAVEDSGDEDGVASVGPSMLKCLKTEPALQAKDKVFSRNGAWFCWVSIMFIDLEQFLEHCGKCWSDNATCFIHGSLRTCQWCHVKKARCSFNESDNGGSMDSSTVLEILQDISSWLACLKDKVERIVEWVDDLMDDYHPDNNIKCPLLGHVGVYA